MNTTSQGRLVAKATAAGCLASVGLLVAFFAWCFSASPGPIRRVGFFKDAKGNRIRTFAVGTQATASDVERSARSLSSTPGQLAAAYYYPEGAAIPADGVTLATNVAQANRAIFETPGPPEWRYAFMIPFVGPTEFVDCKSNPRDGLCEKETGAR